MSWLFRNKLLILLIILGGIYWVKNPADRFGISRNGFVVYKKIPILLFDCYIDPDTKIYLEADLSKKKNITYWYNNHFTKYKKNESGKIPLIIGFGFDTSTSIAIDDTLLQKCRIEQFDPLIFEHALEAINKYNELQISGKKAAILLKIKK